MELTAVVLDIRAQAPPERDVRRRLTHNLETVDALLAGIIRDGIEVVSGGRPGADRNPAARLYRRRAQLPTLRSTATTSVRETLGTVVEEWLPSGRVTASPGYQPAGRTRRSSGRPRRAGPRLRPAG
ncbi:MAG: hypothetical protein V5A55_02725 [Halovenus sp.]